MNESKKEKRKKERKEKERKKGQTNKVIATVKRENR